MMKSTNNMAGKIVKYQTIEMLASEIGEAKLKFYGAALVQLVAFKVYVGRLITSSPHIEKKYGGGFIPKLAEETGLSESILKDCRECYEIEKLNPAREKKFIQSFAGEFSSWNDYLCKRLGRQKALKSATADGECKHCFHCPK